MPIFDENKLTHLQHPPGSPSLSPPRSTLKIAGQRDGHEYDTFVRKKNIQRIKAQLAIVLISFNVSINPNINIYIYMGMSIAR